MATTGAVNDVILEGPDQFHSWFSSMKGSVPEDLWKYFDPKTSTAFPTPEPVTISTVKDGAESLQQLSSAEKTLYTQLRTLYNTEVTQHQRFLSEQAKLRKSIIGTVSEAKRSQLLPDISVREWIRRLQTSTMPTDSQMKDTVRARHRVMMGAKYVDWPTGGPDKWVTEWQKLMSDCERWCPPLHQLWASDFNLVWGEVPGAQRLCDRLVGAVDKDDLKDWNIYRASMELKQAWDQRQIRSGMRVAGRGRITKAAFAVEPQLNGIKAPEEMTDEPRAVPSAPPNLRKRAAPDSGQKHMYNKRNKRTHEPCWGCGGDHFYLTCTLINASNPRKYKVQEAERKMFQEKMRNADFAEKIRKLREAEGVKQELRNPRAD